MTSLCPRHLADGCRLWRLLTVWSFCAAPLFAAGLVVVNGEVPSSMALVEDYRKLHGLETLPVLSLNCAVTEEMPLAQLRDEVLPAVTKAIGEFQPDWILTIYGLPLWVRDGTDKRSVDQLLGLAALEPSLWSSGLPKRIELGEPAAAVARPVCRLGGPSLSHAKEVLESWARLKAWGGFRRCFPLRFSGPASGRLRAAGHWVHAHSDFEAVPLSEVQWLEGQGDQLAAVLRSKSREQRFAPGAMVVRHHSAADEDLPFRSKGSSASQALLRACGFVVSALAPRSASEDLFDTAVFLDHYLGGARFHESVMAAQSSMGGSRLICGDPLAKPYALEEEALRKQTFSQSLDSDADGRFVQAMTVAREWWVLRAHLQKWDEGKFLWVRNLADLAVRAHASPLFREHLCAVLYQLGERAAFAEAWSAWPAASKGPWAEHRYRKHWASIAKGQGRK